ncbi:MAG TPA: Rid family hydrolase [Vicinamibacterales bacterium]|nr:Rid family hydrolase [Vicinamibacterales bacterium]
MLRIVLAAAVCAALPWLPMQKREIVRADPAPVGPYSPAVKAGGLIYVSGTLAQDDKGALVAPGDAAAQTRRIVERMRGILSAAGSSLEQVVSVTVYLKRAGDFQAMNEAYRTFWPKDPPTRTTVITSLLLDADVEISMIAVPNGAERAVLHPASWVKSPNPYSYAIRTGDTVFLSGLVPRNGRDNSTVTGDITVQTRAVMDNAGELLKAAGMTYANIVSARVYLPDASGFQQMNEVYRGYFTSAPPPARATVKAGLAGSQYGVEMTFVASSSPREAIGPGQNLSAAIKAGNRLYLSGVLGQTAENAADAAAQTREVMARIRKTLDAAGYTPADVVDGLVYLTDLSLFPQMNAGYRAFFERDFPARATVGTGLVAPGAVVEIMMTAVKP